MERAGARVIVAMVTPFRPDLGVDYQRAARLSRRLWEQGADGILVAGTTGESPSLADEEKINLLTTVLEAVGDRVEVWAGTGTNCTDRSAALTREATEAGAHGIMLVTPYYNKPPQEALYRHFRRAAEATDLPVMIYNVPSRTGVNLQPETLARLAEIGNISAVKEASGDLDQVSSIRRLVGDDFLIYSGDDSLTLPVLSVGGHGVVSVAGHVVAGDIARMINSFEEGRVDDARAIHIRLHRLFKALFITTNPIPVKAALKLAGFDPGGYRLPMVPPDESQLAVIRDAMEALGILH